jgi:hypothetical protein
MAGRGTVVPPPEITGNEEFLQEVAASAAFAKAPALRRLLLYLWEHRDEELSEYAIAIDALGKREDFDPKLDASVRVHISRLRARLKDYFEGEGNHHGLRLTVPPGTHQIRCEPRAEAVSTPRVWESLRRWLLPGVALVLLVATGILLVRNRSLDRELALTRQNLALPEIWQKILKPGRLTRVIYPMPVFYVWGDLRVRDVKNNVADGWRTSPRLQPLVELLGRPEAVSQSYTVSSDTMAAIELTRFLSSHAIPLEVTNTNNLLLHQYGSDNLIFLGIPPTNPNLDPYLNRTNFHLAPGNGSIGNRDPRPGEPALFQSENPPPGSSVVERHGMVAVLPGHAPNTSLILLMGLHTSALATFVSSPPSIDGWTSRWRSAGSPDYFEMVLRTQSEGVITKSVDLVAFRPIR